MSPEDKRHGTNTGYMAHVPTGDYCGPCRAAHAEYQMRLWRRRYVLGVSSMLVDSVGIQRRIQALQVMGWRQCDIDGRAGLYSGWSKGALERSNVRIEYAHKLVAAYNELCMTRGPGRAVSTWATRKGWLPPLAWDDDTIDDPTAQPFRADPTDDVDEVVIDRIFAGDTPAVVTAAERRETVRRWTQDGRSLASLERQTGWKTDRYMTTTEDVA